MLYSPSYSQALSIYLSISNIHQRLPIVLGRAFFLDSLSVLQMYEAKLF